MARPRRPRRRGRPSPGGVDGEDLPSVDPPDRPALGHVSPDGGQRDLPDHLRVGQGIGEVLPGGPDGRTSRRCLERDQCRSEPAPTEQEVPRCRELRRHLHAPVQVVAVGFHPEEGPCVHGAAPYRRSSASGNLAEPGSIRQSPDRADDAMQNRPCLEAADRSVTAFRPTMVVPHAESRIRRSRLLRGCSSDGRAAALQAVGRGFESLHLH